MSYANQIRVKALDLGFDAVGFAQAQRLNHLEKPFGDWLSKSYHGDMTWLENHFEKRLDPRQLEPGTKTVISLLVNYLPNDYDASVGVSRYAVGTDYHNVLRKKGKQLISFMREEIGDVQARVLVDSAPVMEKEWARLAGLGWIGKNGCFIRPKLGSWFFLVELFTDLHIEDTVTISKNHCGSCKRCIDACPTNALIGNGQIDARKCISYLTIELKDVISSNYRGKWDKWIFGCDICQEVCPWNQQAEPGLLPEFQPGTFILDLKQWLTKGVITENLDQQLKKSALARAGLEKLNQSYQFVHE